MVENILDYIDFLLRCGLQRNTAGSYRRYLESVSKNQNITINRETVSSERDVRGILVLLKTQYAQSYVSNCGTALRKYLAFVQGEKPSFKYAEELTDHKSYFEGAPLTITVNKYERKTIYRNQAIAYHGLNCYVCDFNFERVYGGLGIGYIHVHHTTPLHTIKKQYKVNIKKDLVPVCPNCHAMLHRAKPALTIKQLKAILAKVKS